MDFVYRSRFAAILLLSGAVSSPLAALSPTTRPGMAPARSNLGIYQVSQKAGRARWPSRAHALSMPSAGLPGRSPGAAALGQSLFTQLPPELATQMCAPSKARAEG